MDAFQAALDDLQKESKEQITQVQDRATAAILDAHVSPHRIAVAIAQRFTRERVAAAYPVLCLLDATVVRTSAAAAKASVSVQDQALTAMLKEFWDVATVVGDGDVFAPLHDYGTAQPAWRDKCLRMVRRWRQRKLLSEEVSSAILSVMENGVTKVEVPAAASTAPAGEEKLTTNPMATVTGLSIAAGSPPPPSSTRAAITPAPPVSSFTAVQAQNFRDTLQACVSALESLPPARSALYSELIRAEHFRGPSRVAFQFFEELLSELRREVTTSGTGAAGAAASSNAEASGKGTSKTSEVDPASAGHAREALGKLLDQLHSADDGPDGGGGRSAGAGGSALPTASTTVVRYVSPIFSDIYAKQALAQRGTGFGFLQRKAGHGSGSSSSGGNAGGSGGSQAGSSHNSFYTSYYPKSVSNAQRPFRIPPTRQMHGGTVRLWFPKPQDWVVATDMADLPQYASRNVAEKDRKRTREEA